MAVHHKIVEFDTDHPWFFRRDDKDLLVNCTDYEHHDFHLASWVETGDVRHLQASKGALNATINGSKANNADPLKRARQSIAMTGRKRPDQSEWMRKNQPMRNPETRRKVSLGLTGIKRSESTKDKIRQSRIGTHWPKDFKYDIVTCPHCLKEGGGGNMKRYHFNNCKSKES